MNNQTAPLNNWIDEYHNGVRYGLEGEILIDERSRFQQITIIESTRYGRGLLLDGCWMTAEHQEKHYHESLVHPALCGAEQIQTILIIGGGDGGTARECLKHNEIEHIDMVEVDSRVIELSQKYLPSLGQKAWQDPRLNVHINDGIKWASNSKDSTYDVIIVDGSDPKGPSEGLFNKTFFHDCKRILKPGGVFATQSESPESFFKVHIEIIKTIRKIFGYADPLYGSVPLYPSGWWSWTFAATDSHRYLLPKKSRAESITKECAIWSPKWQKGAFNAIPAFVERELSN